MSKEIWLRIREILFWMTLVACSTIVFVCNQYSGHKLAEKDIFKSCLSTNEFTIDGVKFICVKCATDKTAKEKK